MCLPQFHCSRAVMSGIPLSDEQPPRTATRVAAVGNEQSLRELDWSARDNHDLG